jgi:hypothetical protein
MITVSELIERYQTDPDSTYRKIRFHTRQTYGSHLRVIMADHGAERVRYIKARNLLRWHEDWTPRGATMAHGLMGILRTVMTFGATILDDDDCARVKGLLSSMRFSRPGNREERLTAAQVVAIRRQAHLMGHASIALAQAFQFECTLRQRDCIGEFVPASEPGISDIHAYGEKWLRGLRWSEIDENLVLRHLTSKRQKVIEVDLNLAPMVLEEIAPIPPEWRTGPIIIREKTGLPWQSYDFRRAWRQVARAAGIPDNVQNMDSRAGAISEATDSGAQLEDVRHAATHSNIAMTMRYSRGAPEKVARVMRMRVAARTSR